MIMYQHIDRACPPPPPPPPPPHTHTHTHTMSNLQNTLCLKLIFQTYITEKASKQYFNIPNIGSPYTGKSSTIHTQGTLIPTPESFLQDILSWENKAAMQ